MELVFLDAVAFAKPLPEMAPLVEWGDGQDFTLRRLMAIQVSCPSLQRSCISQY
jgi:hypothetical protein